MRFTIELTINCCNIFFPGVVLMILEDQSLALIKREINNEAALREDKRTR